MTILYKATGMRAQKPIQSRGKTMQYLPGFTVQCINQLCEARGHWLRADATAATSTKGTAQTVEILCVVCRRTGSTISHASTRSNISSPGDVAALSELLHFYSSNRTKSRASKSKGRGQAQIRTRKLVLYQALSAICSSLSHKSGMFAEPSLRMSSSAPRTSFSSRFTPRRSSKSSSGRALLRVQVWGLRRDNRAADR